MSLGVIVWLCFFSRTVAFVSTLGPWPVSDLQSPKQGWRWVRLHVVVLKFKQILVVNHKSLRHFCPDAIFRQITIVDQKACSWVGDTFCFLCQCSENLAVVPLVHRADSSKQAPASCSVNWAGVVFSNRALTLFGREQSMALEKAQVALSLPWNPLSRTHSVAEVFLVQEASLGYQRHPVKDPLFGDFIYIQSIYVHILGNVYCMRFPFGPYFQLSLPIFPSSTLFFFLLLWSAIPIHSPIPPVHP